MIEASKSEEETKPHERLADLFEQQLERACADGADGCDEDISEGILRLAALFILTKEVSNQSNHFTCICETIYTLKYCL